MGVLERGAGGRALVDDQVDVGRVGVGAHPLAPRGDRRREALVGQLGEGRGVLGRADDHLVRALAPGARRTGSARPRGGWRRAGRPSRTARSRAAACAVALAGEHGIEVRHRARQPARRVGLAAVGPVRPDLGRRAVLAPLAEGTLLGGVGLASGRLRGERVRALGPARGEDRPQAGELVDADLGGGQGEAGGSTGSRAGGRGVFSRRRRTPSAGRSAAGRRSSCSGSRPSRAASAGSGAGGWRGSG